MQHPSEPLSNPKQWIMVLFRNPEKPRGTWKPQIPNLGVAGSNPAGIAKKFKSLAESERQSSETLSHSCLSETGPVESSLARAVARSLRTLTQIRGQRRKDEKGRRWDPPPVPIAARFDRTRSRTRLPGGDLVLVDPPFGIAVGCAGRRSIEFIDHAENGVALKRTK